MVGVQTGECPPGGGDAGSWVRRGMACTRRRRFPDAIGSFDRALAYEPRSADALTGRGNALYALGQYGQALAAYDRALEVEPDRPALHLSRSNALSALGRADEAAAAYARAMDLRRRPERG